MHSQFFTRYQAMTSLIGGVSDDFDNYSVVWYDFLCELFYNINR